MADEKNRTGNPIEDFLNETEESPPDGLFQAVPEEEPFNPFDDASEETSDASPETEKPQSAEEPLMPVTETPTPEAPDASEDPEPQPAVDPFAAALAKAQADSGQRQIETLAATPPVFSYASAKEDITDREITFDGLREKYQTDFPELSEKKKVSWTVSYGKTTRIISNPESDKVYTIKAEIEKSKAFRDNLAKAKTEKERNIQCLVTPKVMAQTIGVDAPSACNGRSN